MEWRYVRTLKRLGEALDILVHVIRTIPVHLASALQDTIGLRLPVNRVSNGNGISNLGDRIDTNLECPQSVVPDVDRCLAVDGVRLNSLCKQMGDRSRLLGSARLQNPLEQLAPAIRGLECL